MEGLAVTSFKRFYYSFPKLSIDAQYAIFPSLNDWGRIRTNFQLNTSIEIFKDFNVGLSFYHLYDNRPPEGAASKNDFGVNFTVGYFFWKIVFADLTNLGSAESVVINKDNTTIIGGRDEKPEITKRANQIKAQIETTTSDYDKEKLQERLARLSGGVAVLYVGAATEVEMKEKKDRVDDALHATRAAVEEDIVPGGGVAFIRAIESLEKLKGINDDETTGIAIVKRALEEPMRQIVQNSGIEGSIVVQKVKEQKGDYGFNARTEQYEQLLEAGVIDPTKVTRIAIENAASIAGMLLTTECAVADKPKEEPKTSVQGVPGMGGLDY